MPRSLPHAAILLVMAVPMAAPAAEPDAEGLELFERTIRPVLAERCYGCHSAAAEAKKKLRGGLRLDSREGLLQGGDSGPALEPGHADESLLIAALRYDDVTQMPPAGKLPEAVIAAFVAWVDRGAPDPRTAQATPESASARASSSDPAAARAHWAYRPPRAVPPPAVRDAAWPSGPIDRFLLAQLEAAGLHPGPDADRATLARRLSFDLTGLPPTPEELAAFVADASPAAYERLVDRLLASPHFGERWGRHWLDVARFGESLTLRGLVLKEAWRYRDYVIAAFNADVPFDRFVREQIAGDLLPAASPDDRRQQLVATTFLALGNSNLEEQDKPQLVMDVVDEQLDVIGKGILAQTIACARCHDHKFDPIPTRDYYALAGILRNARILEHDNVSKWMEVPLPMPPDREAAVREHEARVSELEGRLKTERTRLASAKKARAQAETPAAGDLPDDAQAQKVATRAVKAMEAELKRLRAGGPRRDMAMTVVEDPTIGDVPIHIRGSVHNLGATAPRGVLGAATPGAPPVIPAGESGRRQLAGWLAGAENPLSARVVVNRAWHWLFGAGLVRTTDNFGTTGEAPSHPELLDDLAVRFIEDGWSVKRLVRRIVLSRAYRLATADAPRSRAVDPENRLLWRMNRRRLDAECLRDAMLAAAGRLRLEMGGPSYPADLAADYGYEDSGTRRSVYVPVFRNALPELFGAFDFADPSLVVGRRDASTVAPQALFLMNHPFALEQARHAALRLLAGPDRDDPARVDRAGQLALGRPPTAAERRLLLGFLAADPATSPDEAWALVFQVLFASADFRYVN
ncbi:MAG TPA: PSD1 and planctomycete cytochrome C domain-containing protein [Isosphaeraceae bacterium]|jgi:hypothetical protein